MLHLNQNALSKFLKKKMQFNQNQQLCNDYYQVEIYLKGF